MDNIGLAITGYKGLKVLELLVVSNINISWVITYGDFMNEIKSLCEAYNIRCVTNRRRLLELEANKVFFIGWQYLVEPKDNYIVLHDSRLPMYKGFCPTVNALIDGCRLLGVTAFKPTKKLDDGPIIDKRAINIQYPIKIKDAYNLLSIEYFHIIHSICSGTVKKIQPSVGDGTFSLWRDEDDYLIDWTQTRKEIQRFVNAVGYPWDGAKTYAPHLLKILDVEPLDWIIMSPKKNAGKVLRLGKQPVIVCGDGALRITKYKGLPITKLRTRLRCKQ